MYSILREDCSVEIDQMQATNPQWVVERRGRTQFKQVGKVGTVGGKGRGLEGGKRGDGGRTPDTKPPRDQSHPTRVSVKRTQCMRRNKATPGAREEYHFLFEESVQEEETAEDGGIDWWRLLRGGGEWDLSEPVRNAPCFCLLTRETVL